MARFIGPGPIRIEGLARHGSHSQLWRRTLPHNPGRRNIRAAAGGGSARTSAKKASKTWAFQRIMPDSCPTADLGARSCVFPLLTIGEKSLQQTRDVRTK
jgi:hypothetical protein